MDKGYIRLWRKIEDGDLWLTEKFTKAQAWIDLLMLASHKDSSFYLRGVLVEVKRGQIAWGEEKLAKRWKWSRGKLRKFLNDQKLDNKLNIQKNNIISILTIVNYDLYNPQKDSKLDNKKTAKRQQKDIYNNVNNVKNVNNKKNIYGSHRNVLLTLEEYDKLKEKLNSRCDHWIEQLSEGKALKGYTYKSDYLAVLKWSRNDSDDLTNYLKGVK